MTSEAVNKYIEKRYERWLDYSIYHCSQAGMDGEAVDVLNEVLCMLLQKDIEMINRLLSAKSGKYTELDYYILQMIKLNITSDTSPYKHKYKSIPVDENINWQRLEIVEDDYQETDRSEIILSMYNRVREAVEELDLSEYAKRIFYFRFFENESFSDWPGPENKKELYVTYNKILDMVKDKINGGLFL